MATVFFRDQVLTEDDLTVFFRDGTGAAFDPYEVTYDIFTVGTDGLTTQMLPASRAAYHPSAGKFCAVETFSRLLYPTAGDYQIRWRFREGVGEPEHAASSEFALVTLPL